MRKIASVHVDIAELTLEVFSVPEEKRGAWITNFVSCLAKGEGDSPYAEKLLAESEQYRQMKSEKARVSAMSRWEKPKKQVPHMEKPKKQVPHMEKPDEIDEKLWRDFLEGRKWGFAKKGNKETPLTERAWKMIVAEAKKATITIEEALDFIAENQVQTFKAQYIENKKGKATLSSDGRGAIDPSHWTQ